MMGKPSPSPGPWTGCPHPTALSVGCSGQQGLGQDPNTGSGEGVEPHPVHPSPWLETRPEKGVKGEVCRGRASLPCPASLSVKPWPLSDQRGSPLLGAIPVHGLSF